MSRTTIKPVARPLTHDEILRALLYLRDVVNGLIGMMTAGGASASGEKPSAIFDKNCPPPPLYYADCYGDPTGAEAGGAAAASKRSTRKRTKR